MSWCITHMSVSGRWVQERGVLNPLSCIRMPRPPPTTERYADKRKRAFFSLVLSACKWAAAASMCQICPLTLLHRISEPLWIRIHNNTCFSQDCRHNTFNKCLRVRSDLLIVLLLLSFGVCQRCGMYNVSYIRIQVFTWFEILILSVT